MAGNVHMLVQPQMMRAKSKDIGAAISSMETSVKNITAQIEEMSSYWKGDASELQRREYNEQLAEISKMLTRLKTYPERILRMAGIYESTEDIAIEIANSTKPDANILY